ncbi:MAG: Co2+/Mg2+ efflux protein ApaG [Planctomycetota bacterium]
MSTNPPVPRRAGDPALSQAVTRSIRVEVASEFVPGRSNPSVPEYFFAYHVRVSNEGDETVQLVSREWLITDGEGRVERVRGEGVVGEKPVLAPGETFEYTSFCPLATPYGSMHGSYLLVTGGGDTFRAEIAPFALNASGTLH